jgi:hypothetical protein
METGINSLEDSNIMNRLLLMICSHILDLLKEKELLISMVKDSEMITNSQILDAK